MGFIFTPDNLLKVQAGTKTQTRRPQKNDGHRKDFAAYANGDLSVISAVVNAEIEPEGGIARVKWQVGHRYALIPKRGQCGVGFLRLLAIKDEDVRSISAADVKAEGFDAAYQFWRVWCGFYDPKASRDIESVFEGKYTTDLPDSSETKHSPEWWQEIFDKLVLRIINKRPFDLYRAWALTIAAE